MTRWTRRNFLQTSGLGAAAFLLGCHNVQDSSQLTVPGYLGDYRDDYELDPRQAALSWFMDARFGLFIHYGLYSQLGAGEWVQYGQKIPVAEYEKLADTFTAEKFDANFIAQLAVDAGMKYINITTRHHDSFCLFRTKYTPFNTVETAAKRDLIAELAQACDKHKLGFCLYYSHGRDWRHPHAPNNDLWGGAARPKYETPDPAYAYGQDHSLQKFVDFMYGQIEELLTQYGPIANIWLDGYGVPASRPERYPEWQLDKLYAHIRSLQAHCLISSKWGYNGKEDFAAPEIHWLKKQPKQLEKALALDKPIEICTAIAGWGYHKKNDGKHGDADKQLAKLAYAAKYDANLLLNIGPRPLGDIDPQDITILRDIGKHLRDHGWPESADWDGQTA
ncbi:alpha-L-fucosidase [Planctomycetota bacterium]